MRTVDGYLFSHTDDAHVHRAATQYITENADGSYDVVIKVGARTIVKDHLPADHPVHPNMKILMAALTDEGDTPLLTAIS